jgi:hypothetical protein
MAVIKTITIRFKQSTATDVVKNRIRIRPANTVALHDAPFDDIPKPAVSADGYTRIPLADVPSAKSLEGKFDIHITAIDGVGNEGNFLEIDNQTFDLSPPAAPTDGKLE